MTDTSFTIARANDRALIHAVVHRYAHTARDKLDFADMLPLFTPDAELVLPDGTSVPPAELGKVVRGGEAAFIRHHITTVDIRFTGDDSADTETSFLAVTDEAAPDHWGHWHDTFRRQPSGAWLIQRRAIVVEGAAPQGWFHRMYLAR
ncbi:SnoaL-like domain-containing protein [Nocardia amikacinitolerans]|uniref:nuclear transport factor 2 family protein n=1 Tax=Nocardia amikacinitolerans TaxID=756689 RepID=UPI00083588B5|nr:nuclear transport factor 2 family protein [Nocardia amikacinitolerans]MCP2320139.1 SnoaL-like domain-containing protein [Nocardia amikacinitolerans]